MLFFSCFYKSIWLGRDISYMLFIDGMWKIRWILNVIIILLEPSVAVGIKGWFEQLPQRQKGLGNAKLGLWDTCQPTLGTGGSRPRSCKVLLNHRQGEMPSQRAHPHALWLCCFIDSTFMKVILDILNIHLHLQMHKNEKWCQAGG